MRRFLIVLRLEISALLFSADNFFPSIFRYLFFGLVVSAQYFAACVVRTMCTVGCIIVRLHVLSEVKSVGRKIEC